LGSSPLDESRIFNNLVTNQLLARHIQPVQLPTIELRPLLHHHKNRGGM